MKPAPLQSLLLLSVYTIVLYTSYLSYTYCKYHNYVFESVEDLLRVNPNYVKDAPEINDNTKLAYLLPTTKGEGICNISLVDFLVTQHNDFIYFCYQNMPYYDPR